MRLKPNKLARRVVFKFDIGIWGISRYNGTKPQINSKTRKGHLGGLFCVLIII